MSTLSLVLVCCLLGPHRGACAEDLGDETTALLSPVRWKKLRRKEREAAVAAVGQRSSLRDVGLLLRTLKAQRWLYERQRQDWERAEGAWSRKTERLEAPIEKLRRQAYLTGDRFTVSGKTFEWLGADQITGEMVAAKERVEKMYRILLKEGSLLVRLCRAAAVVTATLEGDDRSNAIRQLCLAVDGLPNFYLAYGVHAVAGIRPAEIDAWLLGHGDGRRPSARAAAFESLGRRGSEVGREMMKARLVHPRWQMRAAAIAGLGRGRDADAVDAMMAQMGREEGVLVDHYILVFRRLFGEGLAGNPGAWAAWWRANRARYAAAWRAGRQIERPDSVEGAGQPNKDTTSFYGIRTTSRHVIFVVDMSGSMAYAVSGRDSRFVVAKKELAKAIGTLYQDLADDAGPGSFNIVVYGTYVDVYHKDGMVVASPTAKKKALAWIEKVCIPVGMTNSYDALAAAFGIAEKANSLARARCAADTIYFMTDAGWPNRGRLQRVSLVVQGVAALGIGRHITIHTVGVGAGLDGGMLRDLARFNGGTTVSR